MTCTRCGNTCRQYASTRKHQWYYCTGCGMGYGVTRLTGEIRSFVVTDHD